MTKKIGIIVGSLRKGSYGKQIAKNFMTLLPDGYEPVVIDFSQLPLYNEDLDDGQDVPAAWTEFRNDVQAVDGIMFFTPEYNRSIPGGLKNALDVGSRPMGHNVWDHKPAAIISYSPGAIGGMGGNFALRQPLVFLNMPTLQQPEAYLGHVNQMLDDDQKVSNPGTIQYFQSIVDAYVEFLDRNMA
ncbi:NADPH-dependent FMN reductase [Levilactobacillus bambusae]|uniref:NADPH-dependent FMN reductase n=1 Tax=Levilactobacillus bambusae TaxID=2024736 RepID=A0A2V1N159_9LACO|nr:NAD(P)H-dependent oxidoreductase [Levilactobacillus bambusae]PWG00050.1 NADPH-dependent FMN reductase [Levilactobacillus bambusae]